MPSVARHSYPYGCFVVSGSYQHGVAEPLKREHRITLLSDRRLLGRSRFVSWPDNCCDDKADQETPDDYIDDKHRGVETVEVHPVVVCDSTTEGFIATGTAVSHTGNTHAPNHHHHQRHRTRRRLQSPGRADRWQVSAADEPRERAAWAILGHWFSESARKLRYSRRPARMNNQVAWRRNCVEKSRAWRKGQAGNSEKRSIYLHETHWNSGLIFRSLDGQHIGPGCDAQI